MLIPTEGQRLCGIVPHKRTLVGGVVVSLIEITKGVYYEVAILHDWDEGSYTTTTVSFGRTLAMACVEHQSFCELLKEASMNVRLYVIEIDSMDPTYYRSVALVRNITEGHPFFVVDTR